MMLSDSERRNGRSKFSGRSQYRLSNRDQIRHANPCAEGRVFNGSNSLSQGSLPQSNQILGDLNIRPDGMTSSTRPKICKTLLDKLNSVKETNDILQWQLTLKAGGFSSYSLNRIAVFCNQSSKLLAKFVFKISAFHFYTHAYSSHRRRNRAGHETWILGCVGQSCLCRTQTS